MDLQTILICLAVFFVSAFLIYVILAVTMREIPFEEVRDEQQRKQQALLSKQKEPKKDKKKKFKKGKPTDKGAEEADKKEEVVKEMKMVELELDPEFIEASDSGSASTPPKKTKAGKVQSKPILTNKEEKGSVVKEATQLVHRKNVPKDDVELKHDRDQHRIHNGKEEMIARVSEVKKSIPESGKVVEPVNESQIVSHLEVQKAVFSSAAPAKKDGSKKKKTTPEVAENDNLEVFEKVTSAKLMSGPLEFVNGCGESSSLKSTIKNKASDLNEPELTTKVGNILASVQSAQLNDSDIKSLLDVLAGKLSNADTAKNVDWTKKSHKSDPAVQLRRQLEEKERAFEEEQQRVFSGSAKIKELNQELMNERQNFANLAKLNQDQSGEIQALKARMQDSHAQHLQELNHYRNQLEVKTKQANDSINQTQRLKEENKRLQEVAASSQHLLGKESEHEQLLKKMSVLEQALQQLSMQVNAADNAKKAAENKVKQYEERNAELESVKRDSQNFGQRCKDLSEELVKMETRSKSLSIELEKQMGALRRAEENNGNLIAELKAKDDQLNELNRRNLLTNSQFDEMVQTIQVKDVELQELKSQFQVAISEIESLKEASSQRLHQDQKELAESNLDVEKSVLVQKSFSAADQAPEAKEEAMMQLQEQLDEKLRVLAEISREVNDVRKHCENLEAEKKNLLMSLDAKNSAANETSEAQIAELDELRRLNAKFVADLEAETAHGIELNRVISELQQRNAEIERAVEESSSSGSENVNRLVNELQQVTDNLAKAEAELSSKSQELNALGYEYQQKDADLEKFKAEVEGLRSHNAVLNECQQQCEDLKSSLVTLSEQLQQKEAKQVESEAHLMQLLEKQAKWAESEATLKTVEALEAKLEDQDAELKQLREKLAEGQDRTDLEDPEKVELAKKLAVAELQLKLREADLVDEENKKAERDLQLSQLLEVQVQLANLESELKEHKEKEARHLEAEAEWRRTLEATELSLTERDLQLQHLQEVNAQVVETELQLMELRQKSSELQKVNEKYGSLNELERRLVLLAEKEAMFADSEARDAEKDLKLHQLAEELAYSKAQLEEAQQKLQANETAMNEERMLAAGKSSDSITSGSGKPSETVAHKEVTVFTRVQEKSQWDMSKLVLDLDTKEAEIQILQSVLAQKEATVNSLEADKTRLMEMIENMQMELWAREKKSKETEAENVHKNEDYSQELSEAKQAQSNLQAEVVHYQSILADTERILKQLENNVDSEEQKWKEKYEAVNEEKIRIQEELAELSQNHQEDQKVVELQRHLETTDHEKQRVLLELNQLREEHSQVLKELEALRLSMTVSENEKVINSSCNSEVSLEENQVLQNSDMVSSES